MVDLNKAMYSILVVGMVSSTILYACGVLLLFLQNPNPSQTTLTHYSNLSDFVQQLLTLRASALLMFATIVLIGTPIARVFLSVCVFAVNRDRKFVVITGVVVAILVVSIILGYYWNLSID
jgi:uncharacterized membrane protein